MPQPKLAAFLARYGVVSPSKAKKKSPAAQKRPNSKQARLGDMAGVVKLPKMSGHATEAELHRLLQELTDSSSSDEAIVNALKQLACYFVTVDQVGLSMCTE